MAWALDKNAQSSARFMAQAGDAAGTFCTRDGSEGHGTDQEEDDEEVEGDGEEVEGDGEEEVAVVKLQIWDSEAPWNWNFQRQSFSRATAAPFGFISRHIIVSARKIRGEFSAQYQLKSAQY